MIRELIEEARQRQPAAPPPAELVVRTHELARYTASLLTGLVRHVVTNHTAADTMIEKAIADGTTIPPSQPATPSTPIVDAED